MFHVDWRPPPPDEREEELAGALFASAPQALQRVLPALLRLTLPHDLHVKTVVCPPPPPPLVAVAAWAGLLRSSSACKQDKSRIRWRSWNASEVVFHLRGIASGIFVKAVYNS